MIALIRSELLKARTTRLAWGMPLAMFLVGGSLAALMGLLYVVLGELPGGGGGSPADLWSDLTLARMVYAGGSSLGYLLALVLGILAMSGEFRHRTITPTLLAAPRRGQVIAAKVLALVAVVTANALAFLVGSLLGGAVMLAVGERALFPEPGVLAATLLRLLLVLVLWGLMGFGLGVLIPNQVVALFVGVGLAWIVEPLLGVGLSFVDGLKGAARFFPSQASAAALDLYSGLDADTTGSMGGAAGDPLTWWVACLVLLGYAALLTAAGWLITARRDVG